jgi:hypothetical protein
MISGEMRVDIRDAIPLERVADAHRFIEGGSSTGKLVLEVNSA